MDPATRERATGASLPADDHRPGDGRRPLVGVLRALGWGALPAALALREAAFARPGVTERLYGQILYPRIAGVLGALNGWMPVSLAEVVAAVLAVALGAWVLRRRRRGSPGRHGRRLLGWLEGVWVLCGVALLAFLLLWGLNYARPDLAARLELQPEPVEAEVLLQLGRGLAAETAVAWGRLDAEPGRPTRLELTPAEVGSRVDARLRELRLPGLVGPPNPSPPKPLWLSPVLSHLGLSGVFVPFTGEPSVNADVPDASMPLVVAHEKAHQHGITDEGEAGLVAWMACMEAEHPYLRYAARLYGASRLLGAVSGQLPEEEAAAAYRELGAGPLADLAAIREFWARHRGAASRAATRLNDAYLRSNRVTGGVRSYGRFVDLLVALERRRREAESGSAAGPWPR